MVSYARVAMGDGGSPGVSEQTLDGMSAAMDSHACCKAKHKALNRTKAARKSISVELTQLTVPTPGRSNSLSCCPLTSGSIVVASRSQSSDSSAVLAKTDSSSVNLTNANEIRVTVPLRLPNRAQSYLLDCAFLI